MCAVLWNSSIIPKENGRIVFLLSDQIGDRLMLLVLVKVRTF